MSKRNLMIAIAAILVLGASPIFASTLAVTNAAAMTGSFGLEITVDGTPNTIALVEARGSAGAGPTQETHHLARFEYDPNGLTMNNVTWFQLFNLRGQNIVAPGEISISRIYTIRKNNLYRLYAMCKFNNNVERYTTRINVSGPVTVELDWTAGTLADPNNGCCLTVVGSGTVCRNDVNNSAHRIDAARLGLVGNDGLLLPNAGSYYLDTYESFR
ncbi:MAG: hypothetical protein K0U98_02035 [Deltaproteobacteria bacterium]|nr:hypothetical protein [Deltaproteobacteria bacterium]